ncbi:putative carboxypeptidase C [Helianthus annuus]|uniref:Carboxypeptidase n=1 Tax=Helianthus annuus TaxID=4232 RepID=A0A251U7B6_HELAN|nr:serine carboxypeptidase 1 [Helianthus annuus]KAF5821981.1 putative carboxypeptidase C [Helianthus annuus]KAJ0622635.1 putative carboxypeptidase C [Helianthus annuus]
MNKITFSICITFTFLFFSAHSAPENAAISQIPGFDGTLPSKHYAGYVTIDENHGKKLYYYYVLSERNPSEDPVVLWLNGGPGCSSFDGFVYEHGPFNFEKTGGLPKLHLNPYTWTKVSNVIYLDSPAGVGLSYSENKTDYITGDIATALDAHKFLLEWFKIYPEYLSNPFFISGESYAGVYVPMLSYEVVKGLDAGVIPTINFKGYMVGNGVADEVFDGNAIVPFAHGMGLISDELYEEVVTVCEGKYYNSTKPDCERALSKVDEDVAGINMYNILEACYHGDISSKISLGKSNLPASFRKLGETERPLPVRTRMFGRAWPFRAPVKPGYVPSWPELLNGAPAVPCTDDVVATIWLNNEEVRKAIHADPINVAGDWVICTDKIAYYSDAGSMIPYHKILTARGYRALIFSGDHDLCVPFTGSEAWTRSLGYQVIDEWRRWWVDDQVAGFIQGYDNGLTFLTIKGSGHTVPEYKPKEALAFYSRWLEGKNI